MKCKCTCACHWGHVPPDYKFEKTSCEQEAEPGKEYCTECVGTPKCKVDDK